MPPFRTITAEDLALPAYRHDPIGKLYVRGDADPDLLARNDLVAVVGARACSAYGATVARKVGGLVASSGGVVVTGLARGVDAEATRGALDAGGRVVAVLGCGIDRDYPVANSELARRIVETGGLIVSEYEPGVEPAPWRFPARNRIIAALSKATIVVEARHRSGSLITADFALELGRPVYAVPGEITSLLFGGTNRLIADGHAKLVASVDETVAEILGYHFAPGEARKDAAGRLADARRGA